MWQGGWYGSKENTYTVVMEVEQYLLHDDSEIIYNQKMFL